MKSRTTAAVLGIFLGWLGIHRFYLGQWFLGFLYLLFCWSFIPALVGLIDGIAFLLMSDDGFNLKYNSKYLLLNRAQQPTVVINNTNTIGQNATPVAEQETNITTTPTAKKSPGIDPFQKSGDEKYADYDFDGAIKDYLRSLNVNPKNEKVHFNLACLYSLLEKKDSAFFHLSKAVEHGYYDFDQIKEHDHLAFLRTQSPDFENFVRNGYKFSDTLQLTSPVDGPLELSDRVIEGIERLAKLRDQGVISEEEFQGQKAKLLAK